MAKSELFRSAIIGGYNKADVMEYVGKLEKEIERLQVLEKTATELEQTVSGLLAEKKTEQLMEIPEKPEVHEENEILSEDQEGLDILKEKAQKYDESYGAIKQLLLDSRIEAQVLLTDARQKAAGIIREAEEQAEMLRAEARSRLNRELLQFRGSAGNIQQELENMQDCVQVILHQISEESEKLMLPSKEDSSNTGDERLKAGENASAVFEYAEDKEMFNTAAVCEEEAEIDVEPEKPDVDEEGVSEAVQ